MSRSDEGPEYVPTDPAQVLDVLRDVLLEHMDSDDALPVYRVADVLLIGQHGGTIDDDDVQHVVGRTAEPRAADAGLPDGAWVIGDMAVGLLLLMRDGSRLRLMLTDAGRDRHGDPDNQEGVTP